MAPKSNYFVRNDIILNDVCLDTYFKELNNFFMVNNDYRFLHSSKHFNVYKCMLHDKCEKHFRVNKSRFSKIEESNLPHEKEMLQTDNKSWIDCNWNFSSFEYCIKCITSDIYLTFIIDIS